MNKNHRVEKFLYMYICSTFDPDKRPFYIKMLVSSTRHVLSLLFPIFLEFFSIQDDCSSSLVSMSLSSISLHHMQQSCVCLKQPDKLYLSHLARRGSKGCGFDSSDRPQQSATVSDETQSMYILE